MLQTSLIIIAKYGFSDIVFRIIVIVCNLLIGTPVFSACRVYDACVRVNESLANNTLLLRLFF